MSRPLTLSRLDELETLLPEPGGHPDHRMSVPTGDLEDLVALIPIVRAAERLRMSIELDEPDSPRALEELAAYDQIRPRREDEERTSPTAAPVLDTRPYHERRQEMACCPECLRADCFSINCDEPAEERP